MHRPVGVPWCTEMNPARHGTPSLEYADSPCSTPADKRPVSPHTPVGMLNRKGRWT